MAPAPPKPPGSPLRATPARAVFQCTACGRCCYHWNIPVDRAAWERLGTLLVPGPENPKGYDRDQCMTLHATPSERHHATLKMADGHCVFLEDDQLCYLHRQFGPEAKPVICRAFPSTTVNTPWGVFLGPSFACKGMILALQKTAGDIMPRTYPADGLAGAASLQMVDVPPSAVVPWGSQRQGGILTTAVDDLLNGWLSLFRLEAQSAEESVLMGRLWLDELVHGNGLRSATEVTKSVEPHLDDGGRKLVQRARELPTSLTIQVRILSVLLHRRLGLGGVMPGSLPWFEQLLTRYRLGHGSLDESTGLFQTDLEAFYLPVQKELRRILITYVGNRLFYHNMLFTHGVVPAYHAIITLFALIRFFAVSRASIRGVPVGERAVLSSIELVEREFSHAASLFDFWKEAANIETQRLPFAAILLQAR
ncbi:MAG: YkgJ family cysteine cluster protein [Deltaproteobacteria bacterium]|nr:YkgJ family cysteine cluster protein [Deltaproteobacteria bacterium]